MPQVREPGIRVGLKSDSKTVLLSGNGITAYSDGVKTGAVSGALYAHPSYLSTSQSRYFVQLGSFSTKENAQKALADAREKMDEPGLIFENPDLSKFQLRLGPYSTPEDAQRVIETAKGKGYNGAFYINDQNISGAIPDLVVSDESGRLLLKTRQPVRFWSSGDTISIDDKAFRGYASVFVNGLGRLTVVNVLNFEDYLKGVVPNEIGPASSSTFEALKAQAVAARTYAYKNLKQFDDEGYDICATPRCQVYSGFSTENALTSQAVEETRGQILTYQGAPINALYTSTCGGRTEAAEYMFEGWNYPYLKSVDCYPEQNGTVPRTMQIDGAAAPWWLAWVNLKAGIQLSGNLDKPISVEEAQSTLQAMLSFLGKTACDASVPQDTSWVSTGQSFIGALCWQAKVDALLSDKDYQYFLSHLNFSLDPSPQTHSFLFLFHEGILVPTDLTRFNPYQPMTRSEYLQGIFRILQHYHQVNTTDGLIREIDQQNMQVVDDVGVHSLPLSGQPYVYQKIGDAVSPRNPVACGPGDNVQYLLQDGTIRLLVCELSQSGASMDRSSKYSFWQDHVDPSELGNRVSKYLDVGDILDLQPLSYGVSHRVYEMQVTGTKGSGVLKGIRVRWALGLKDNLFTIDRSYGSGGKISEFIFTGRGWGHGVGMCQVGAVGYARMGKDYQYILLHYYTGVQITSAY